MPHQGISAHARCNVRLTSQRKSAPAGFYSGRIAEAIVAALAERDGVLVAADLGAHRTAFVDPLSSTYRGHTVYEVPPPTQASPGIPNTVAPGACLTQQIQ